MTDRTEYSKNATSYPFQIERQKGGAPLSQGSLGAKEKVGEGLTEKDNWAQTEKKAYSTMEQSWASFRTNGSALPSRFEVMIHPPVKASRDARDVGLRCERVSLPGKNLTTSPDTNVYGVQPMIVDGVTFAGTANMVFTASQDMRERELFEKWQKLAWHPETWNIGYYQDYIGSIDIYLLNSHFDRVYGIHLMECYPKEINQNDLSAAPATEALKLTVQIQYKYWQKIDLETYVD